MKIVITGASGNISKPLAEQLLAEGNQITVIGRSLAHLQPLIDKGATAKTGSVDDVSFLKQAFIGADAVYTMVPPNFGATQWKQYIGQVAQNYAEAIKENRIPYVVNLSSVGAHLPDGVGPVSGLFLSEKNLNASGANVLHLRPGYFYTNFLANIDLVRNHHIIGSNFGADIKLVLSHPLDIAKAAARALTNQGFKGSSNIQYLSSDERKPSEIAAVFGNEIGKPQLPWIKFGNEDLLQALIGAGLPSEIAGNYVEMGTALDNGSMLEDYWKNKPVTGAVTLENFAKTFSQIYAQSEKVA